MKQLLIFFGENLEVTFFSDMKFTVSSGLLGKQLSKASVVLMNNPVLPILESFLFEIKGSVLIVTASDMQTSITTTVEISPKDNHTDAIINIAVPAKLLLETIKSIVEQPITFTIDVSTYAVSIFTSNGVYKLVGENALDFPRFTLANKKHQICIKNKLLKSLLSTSLVTTSKDELKPALNGVYIGLSGEELTFVSTDTFKLSKLVRHDLVGQLEGDLSFILPRKAMHTLISLLSGNEDMEDIIFEQDYIQFIVASTVITARLINERFPAYENVIPKSNDKIAIVNRLDLLRSLKRIAIFANRTTKYVGFSFEKDKLELVAEDRDFSNEARESIPCYYAEEPISLGFNVSSFIDLLNSVSHDTIEIKLSEPGRACLIVPQNTDTDESTLLLIMPMIPPKD